MGSTPIGATKDMRVEQVAVSKGYKVTEEGQLINPKGKEIGTIVEGYYETFIRVDKKRVKLKPHRLQAYQKYGKALYGGGVVVRHKNGDSSDNTWGNILIGTQSDNMMDMPEEKRRKRANHATSFMRKHDKEKIKKFHKKEKSYKLTMEKFGISSKGTLNFILNN